MTKATLLGGQAGTESGPEEPQASAPAPVASYLLDALVAILEEDPARPVKMTDKVYVRASALVPVLIEALELAQEHYQPESIRVDGLLRRIEPYTLVVPMRCKRCDKLMDAAETRAGDTCQSCAKALEVAGMA